MVQLTKHDVKALGAAALAIVLVFSAAYAWRQYLAHQPHPETFSKAYALTLSTYDGKPVRLSDYRGKVVVAYAWASWCPYCAGEIEDLATLKKTYGDRVQILAINRAEPLPAAKAFTDRLQNTDGVLFLLDPTDSFFKSVGGYAMPETIFIRPNGEVAFHQHGPIQMPAVTEKLQQLTSQ